MKTRQDNISLLLAGKGQSALCGLTFFYVMEVSIWTVLKCYCRWIHLYKKFFSNYFSKTFRFAPLRCVLVM